MLSFEWPWFFLLLPLPWLIAKLYKKSLPDNAVQLPPNVTRALNQIDNNSRYNITVLSVLPWLAWLLFVVAMAQPAKTGDAQVQAASGRAIAMVVDVSGSMSRTDFTVDDVQTDRLSAVKQVAGEFMRKRRGDRMGLVLFGNEAFIASPLSFDTQAIANNLNSAGIGMAGRSTAIGDALGLAIKLLDNDPASSKAIILLSDGTNNAGTTEPENAAELASSFGIQIHTIAMGSEGKKGEFSTAASADLDETTLQNIAKTANGQYYRVRSFDDLKSVYEELASLDTAVGSTPPVLIKIDLRNIVLLILFIVVLIIFCLQAAENNMTPRQPS